ncbi:uncharacterized protein LOC107303838 isoform X3 [Oryza brachyantha]|uniref:uncharacterized protein LOC107303838 isoform X3 n=1 Tax=Oryza brachyantha TaxID=4533 RepID=UPI000776A4B8|nr:uncharacterized protein LOC107303838 isoform X3 [Oryza brachyantha]
MNFHLAHPRSQLATMSGVTHSRATPLRLRVRRRQSNAERSNRNNSSASAPGDGDADGFLWSQVKTVIIISYPTERPCDGRGLRGLDGDLPQVKSARCSAPMSLPGPYDAVVCGETFQGQFWQIRWYTAVQLFSILDLKHLLCG